MGYVTKTLCLVLPISFLLAASAQAADYSSTSPSSGSLEVYFLVNDQLFTGEDPVFLAKPADKAPADKAPADKAPADKAPADKAPADKAPADKAPADKAPADKAPADKAPADKAPADKAPADKAPADKAPVDETPVDETPVDETPVDETPVDGAPSEDVPVDGIPFEEVISDGAPIDNGNQGGLPDGGNSNNALGYLLVNLIQSPRGFRIRLNSNSKGLFEYRVTRRSCRGGSCRWVANGRVRQVRLAAGKTKSVNLGRLSQGRYTFAIKGDALPKQSIRFIVGSTKKSGGRGSATPKQPRRSGSLR